MISRSLKFSTSRNFMIIYPRHTIRQGMHASRRRPFQSHIRRLTRSLTRTPQMLESCTRDCRSGPSLTTPLKRRDGLLCSSICAAPTGGMRYIWRGNVSSASTSTFHPPTPLASHDQVVSFSLSFLFISSSRISIQLFSVWIQDTCPGYLFMFHLFLFCSQ